MNTQEPDLNTNQVSGHWKQFNNSHYIGAPDLLNEDGQTYRQVKVKVEGVFRRNIFNPGNRQFEEKTVIAMVGKKKGFIVNKTNMEAIAKLTGEDLYQNWVGKEFTLTVQNVKLGRDTVPGLRVK